VLVVDDELDVLHSVKAVLEMSLPGVHVEAVSTGEEALACLARAPPDLIMSDYRMPGMDGLELLARARAMVPTVPRVLITAYPEVSVALRAINEVGVAAFLTKPFEPAKVVDMVRVVLASRHGVPHPAPAPGPGEPRPGEAHRAGRPAKAVP
jgi:CheY-like chemotaxis protein